MRPSFATGLSALALAMSLLALLVTLVGSVDPGVVADGPGGVVQEVDPNGIAWRAGIRPGQHVVLLSRAEDAGGWILETTDTAGLHRVSISASEGMLRTSSPMALVASLLAVVAFGVSRTSRRRAELTATLALVLAAIPFGLVEQGSAGTAVVLIAGLGPLMWIARWHRSHRVVAFSLVGAGVAVGLAWIGLRAINTPAAAAAGQIWTSTTALAVAAMLAIGIGVTPARLLHTIASSRALDGTVLAAGGIAAVALLALGLPVPVVLIIVLLPLLGYARARTGIANMVDRLLLAELRERASIRATEEERARLSRAIHDDPLQALAGVIQRLEDPQPDAAAARESLRTVAARLRGVATELHPPVLDDLGLVPAIEAAARQITPIKIEVRVNNSTGYARSQRPPSEVEIAIYRIVHEAMLNASRHSGGQLISVNGDVSATRIALEVVDDGVGITEARIEQAMKEGHLGLASMRRRASAIDARLEQADRPPRGSKVSIRWPG
jgi:signal transduction histidine kinase